MFFFFNRDESSCAVVSDRDSPVFVRRDWERGSATSKNSA